MNCAAPARTLQTLLWPASRAFTTSTRYTISAGPASQIRAPHGAYDPDNYAVNLAQGEAFIRENGYDIDSLIEQPVIWGDCDPFQHVNNVMHIRYYETGRMRLMQSLLPDLSPSSQESLIKGKPGGLGVILGSISSRYRVSGVVQSIPDPRSFVDWVLTFFFFTPRNQQRPVTFPDRLLIGHRIKSIGRYRFRLEHVCWSIQQKTAVNTGECEMVCYNYGALKTLKLL
ncbi:BQ2448_8117 [Microbotryum intermedium]|uniref:BQ2448_8117 protein n=1 Tax=Microbotryum intermedium TaxID=269621 RepID=A0A238FTD2_9BASI|nr:BQ2448_8117 [Microbotryum intermedium]